MWATKDIRDEAERRQLELSQAVLWHCDDWIIRYGNRRVTFYKEWKLKTFSGLDELVAAQGSQLGPTEWLEVTQNRVNVFADATDDHQWIHVDAERAANGPFGGTIAHGLLTLSLLPHFMHQLYTVSNITMAINYGYNKVRFITPVKVGAKIRARAEITKVDQLDGGAQATMTTTVEIDGSEKPAAVAESIVRFLG